MSSVQFPISIPFFLLKGMFWKRQYFPKSGSLIPCIGMIRKACNNEHFSGPQFQMHVVRSCKVTPEQGPHLWTISGVRLPLPGAVLQGTAFTSKPMWRLSLELYNLATLTDSHIFWFRTPEQDWNKSKNIYRKIRKKNQKHTKISLGSSSQRQ